MRKNIFNIMIAVSMAAGLLAGCGSNAAAADAQQEPTEETTEEIKTEETDKALETTEETSDEEAGGQDGFIFGTYWGVTFDPDLFVASQDGNVTTLSYQNDPAGSAFYVFTETDYTSPAVCMDEISATVDLYDYTELTVCGKNALFASVKTDDSQESELKISDVYYAIDVDGRILQVEEFTTLAGDEETNNAIYWDMSQIISDNLDFEETGDYPDNFLEERTGIFSYDSYDQIIGLLEEGEGYAYVDIMGMEDPVLVITNDVFTPDETTANCLSCYPYFKNATGKYICGSLFSTISTATPIAVSDDGVVYCATHQDMTKLVFDENGQGIMALEYDHVEWGEDENTPNTYSGFVRSSNSFSADEIQIASDDSSYFDKAFEEYNTLTPINFTMVK